MRCVYGGGVVYVLQSKSIGQWSHFEIHVPLILLINLFQGVSKILSHK